MVPKDDKHGDRSGMRIDWKEDEFHPTSHLSMDDAITTGDELPPMLPTKRGAHTFVSFGDEDSTQEFMLRRQEHRRSSIPVGIATNIPPTSVPTSITGSATVDTPRGFDDHTTETDNESEFAALPDDSYIAQIAPTLPRSGRPPAEPDEPTPAPPPPQTIAIDESTRDQFDQRSRRSYSRAFPVPHFATKQALPNQNKLAPADPALASNQSFRRQLGQLARSKDYASIADLYESAIAVAPWAASEDIQVDLLLNLAKLYKDRLNDPDKALFAFERLVDLRPGHNEAMDFLRVTYEANGDKRKLHDVYALAVDTEWSPERRLELTRAAARIALDELGDSTTAARDWEHLLELGDMDVQVTVELSQVYREAERWPDLGQFLENRAAACEGPTRVAVLREAVEAFLSGADSPDRAEALIEQVLTQNPDDPIALASLANVRARQRKWDSLEEIAQRPMSQVPIAAKLDVLRLIANLLTAAGDHDRASTAYLKVLEAAPNDAEAVSAREEHLRRIGDHEGLVSFLTARANKVRNAEEKAGLLERAASVADEFLGSSELAANLF
ncbi:MAG: tetratricopeptide repeat protein, partial [Polyangiaceae bacterium]|nr:tetratricopeptide repeat protein [Polyangiaceae bacterium]